MVPVMNNLPPAPESKAAEDQTLDHWATWMAAQSWSETTIRERVITVRRVARDSGCSPTDLTKSHLLTFLSRTTFKASTRQKYYRDLKAWFDWVVVEEELRTDNPMAKIRKPDAPRQTQRWLTSAHLVHLMGSRLHKRTKVMILLMAYQGLRAFEVAKFRGDDIDVTSKEIRVVGKGGVEAILPLHPLIGMHREELGPDWWFPQWTANRLGESGGHILGGSVTRIVADAMRRNGVPGTGHKLRHWHATEMRRAGVDSLIIQQLMRHASLDTTQIYMHADDTQRRAGLLLLPDVTTPLRPTESPAPGLAGVTTPSRALPHAA